MAEQSPAVAPVTGALPDPGLSDARKPKKGKLPAGIWDDFGEEFRILRSRVAAALKERHKIVLVTSALPQEGKSTVSANLARSFAQMEWRTLLVDFDLRKPSMHAIFGIERAPGLTELLQGRVPEEGAIAASNSPHLDLLSSGSPTEGGGTDPLRRDSGPAEEAGRALRLPGRRRAATDLDHRRPAALGVRGRYPARGQRPGLPPGTGEGRPGAVAGRPVLGVVLNGISTPKKYGYYY